MKGRGRGWVRVRVRVRVTALKSESLVVRSETWLGLG